MDPFTPTVVVVLAVVFYSTALGIYRLLLSPLARFPGPKLTALTGWYETYKDVFQGGQFIFEIEKWHQQYGPIIRINPWEVHIADAEFYQTLYSNKSRYSKPKAWKYRFGLPLSTFDVIEHDHHRRRRQAVSPFFSRQRVFEYLPYVQERVDQMCKRLETEYAGKDLPVSLDDAYAALTSDVINYYSFGVSYNFLDYPDFQTPFTTSIRKLARSLHLSGHFPWFLALMQSLPPSVVAILNPDMKPVFDFHGEIRAQIQRLMADKDTKTKSNNHRTIFTELLHSKFLQNEEKSLDLLQQEAASLTGAGIETTKTALAMATFHILDNPAIYQRLRAELRDAMPDPVGSPLSLSQLEKLPYLHAVVQEALRLSFGISQRLVRIDPYSPIKYGKYVIPPGVPFSMTSYLQHRDCNIFPDPDEFRPGRWLGQDDGGAESEQHRGLSKYLVPFGSGPRMCLGMNLANAEMYLALAHVFRRLDLELFETKRNAVDMDADYFIPVAKAGTKGVRVLVK
ncbi:cytochrome P450 [Penicillium canescens]|uniref:Cytochrome P450 n=1 Tax=Penicillium canescens TaxID=5083 RepID=A0AAD6ICS6_PENCN|nr:cytochrome P450 [Penicillium canescens]KAJ6043515.1 cytochrome P450 [Penicillium canescens]KAJ6054990.1 cytochrome P450 [Penicillium canescens]KAJ6073937.1 cytochrome P450 [Penicillium canescens]KAJ6081068.1 cytochrome P450 [Penicillium canescens]KAJ6177136.1 cytochrome P450 [Penicillium canescens]